LNQVPSPNRHFSKKDFQWSINIWNSA
jgi:hypothetical protein